ncbi:MAG TPA: HupE/UreJ family protein, partial [Verrucomicrobiae bacterium]|nr:HupE/UreJ family protein [Verrucomicrobiae bacterium]
ALVDLGLHGGQLAAALFGFNAGVELGQLAIAATLLPLALALRQQWVYEHLVLRVGSVAIMVVAAGWLAERVFDFKWLPF